MTAFARRRVLTGLIVSGIIAIGVSGLSAQEKSKHWIFFADRASESVHPFDVTSAARFGISDRALWRRGKVLPADKLIDELDRPVSARYIQALRDRGLSIKAVSRWFNAVSVEATASELESIEGLPYVESIEPVMVQQRRPPETSPMPRISGSVPKRSTGTDLDYGASVTQLNSIGAIELHRLGINGRGVIVGMIDDGFNNHRTHLAMKGIRVIAEYDFIHCDSSTSAATWEYRDALGRQQGWHGTLTLSALAGFAEGQLIGPAYGASLILAKTEIDSVEIQREEDLYVEALEWMERLGADVVSTSLGYIDWYSYRHLDGRTAITSKAARIAARKGILLVTAMGNETWYRTRNPDSTGTLIAPADADSIVAVGATYSDGELASFSSTGPTFDGRIKPEVVAQGVSVISASYSFLTGFTAASGTSLSTPLAAGSAALVLSAHPYLTPMQVRQAFLETTTLYRDGTSRSASYPNNFYGWGRVHAYRAALYHGPLFDQQPRVTDLQSALDVSTTIVSSTPLSADSIFVYYRISPAGGFERVKMRSAPGANTYTAKIPASSDTAYPQGYFSVYTQATGTRRYPFDAPQQLVHFRRFISNEIKGPVPETFILYQNYPNPFSAKGGSASGGNAGTMISFSAPREEYVELIVYDILGQRVKILGKGVVKPGPQAPIFWDGTDESGNRVPSGVYLYRLHSMTASLAQKMIIVR